MIASNNKKLTNISSLKVIIVFVDVHVVTVDEEQFVELIIPHQTISHSNVFFQQNDAFVHGETIETANAFVVINNISLFFIDHCSEEETTLLVNFDLVESYSIVLNFTEDLLDLSDGVNSIPLNLEKTLSSSNDELIALSLDWDNKADGLLTQNTAHVDHVGVQIHFEDLTSKNVSPEQNIDVLVEEKVLAEQGHDTFTNMFNSEVWHSELGFRRRG